MVLRAPRGRPLRVGGSKPDSTAHLDSLGLCRNAMGPFPSFGKTARFVNETRVGHVGAPGRGPVSRADLIPIQGMKWAPKRA